MPRIYDPVPKLLQIQAEKNARIEAFQRWADEQRSKKHDVSAELGASYFSFGITLLILGAAVCGIMKTGGL
ncbi:hypothetical protein [Methylomonas sp. 11b]|uniref:hypothetical protein n=1 Tax=Methylomonas sp. 11b TaxID=1168169 RepID=UPI00047D5729|nr:hypothetical protein [Methylomonas sp. 11b]